jgi:hypothetical protein
MSKVAAVLAGLSLVPVVALATAGGCSSTSSTMLTNCSTYTPDAGADPNITCAIGWICNPGPTLLQITCTGDPKPEFYDCSCSNGTTTTKQIVVDTFICDGMGSLPTANMGCGFNIAP